MEWNVHVIYLVYFAGIICKQLFRSLNQLQNLDISHNNLVNIDGAFESTTQLIQLTINDNQLKFGHLQNLAPEEKPNSPFQHLQSLETLNLAKNNITYIARDWRMNLMKLKLLDLRNNQITKLEDFDLFSYWQEHELKVLLNNNEIKRIIRTPNRMPDMVEKQLITINLGGKSLNCDCFLLHFLLYLKEYNKPSPQMGLVPKVYFNVEKLKCERPVLLANYDIMHINATDLVCIFDMPLPRFTQCPKGCICMIKPLNRILQINCKNAKFTQLPELPIFENEAKYKEIILNLENNNIARLQPKSVGYERVTRLYLAGNDLEQFEIQQLPPNLNHLDLSRNKFRYIKPALLEEFKQSKSLKTLELGDNPWQCDCDTTRSLLEFIQIKRDIIEKSRTTMKCANYHNNNSLYNITLFELCSEQNENVTTWTLLLSLAGLLAGLLAALYFKYQRQITLWLYIHNLCICLFPKAQLDRKGEYEYDIFMSYSHKDSELVRQALVPKLREEPYAYRLCIDEDNWMAGSVISEEIARSVEDSYCTMIVLSKNYIESKWAKWEFKTALQSSLVDRKHRLIMIKYGDIGKIEDLDKDLKAYLKYNLYLEWGDKKFWEKLRFTLSHTDRKKSKISSNNRSEHQHHVNDGGTMGIANGITTTENIKEMQTYAVGLNKDRFSANGYQQCLPIELESVPV